VLPPSHDRKRTSQVFGPPVGKAAKDQERPRRSAYPTRQPWLAAVSPSRIFAYCASVDLISMARDLARSNLAFEQPQRWRHTEVAAQEAERIVSVYGADGPELLIATWLHDVGAAPVLARTGFPALDGARFLRAEGWLPRVVNLVANHSGAALEADLRGLGAELREFPDEQTPVRDALWYCDLTTGPDGEPADVEDRIAELVNRPDVGPRFVERARDELTGAVRRTRTRLRAARLT